MIPQTARQNYDSTPDEKPKVHPISLYETIRDLTHSRHQTLDSHYPSKPLNTFHAPIHSYRSGAFSPPSSAFFISLNSPTLTPRSYAACLAANSPKHAGHQVGLLSLGRILVMTCPHEAPSFLPIEQNWLVISV